jgi:hypothetical protein
VTETGDQREESERAQRRAARKTIAAYHEEQLGLLLERVRVGFARLDAGEIDVFELDELIHHYKQAARELWKFCNLSGGSPRECAPRARVPARAGRRAGLVGSRPAAPPATLTR